MAPKRATKQNDPSTTSSALGEAVRRYRRKNASTVVSRMPQLSPAYPKAGSVLDNGNRDTGWDYASAW